MTAYVVVRSDLSKSQQAVQAGHALAEYLKEHGFNGWYNGTLIYLKVKDVAMLISIAEELMAEGHLVSDFYEPDLGENGEYTAVCTIVADQPTILAKLPLMR